MRIIKKVQGRDVELELEEIQKYNRYTVYQVYKIKNGERIPKYRESYTDSQMREIINNKNIIIDDTF